jgi:hypothetical protein
MSMISVASSAVPAGAELFDLQGDLVGLSLKYFLVYILVDIYHNRYRLS